MVDDQGARAILCAAARARRARLSLASPAPDFRRQAQAHDPLGSAHAARDGGQAGIKGFRGGMTGASIRFGSMKNMRSRSSRAAGSNVIFIRWMSESA